MFNFNTLPGVVTSILAMAMLLGVVVVVARASFRQATNEELRKVNDDLRDEIEDRNRRDGERDKAMAEMKARIDALEKENETLREMAFPREIFESMQTSIDRHHEEALRHWAEVKSTLDALVQKAGGEGA
jgi:UPF0716 family protein affecting phage T7 exclusion